MVSVSTAAGLRSNPTDTVEHVSGPVKPVIETCFSSGYSAKSLALDIQRGDWLAW